jgi:Arc/MetJ family transcription regulator
MRTGVTLDDELLARAHELSGLSKRRALLNEALRALIQREAARHLADLGGTMPDMKSIRRRRPKPESKPDDPR